MAEFHRLLDLDFDATARDDSGEKRKRDDPRGGERRGGRNDGHIAPPRGRASRAQGPVRTRHGAVIYVPSGGGGGGRRRWAGRKNKIVLHSEVHAVADAIFNYGEDECFERVFPRATIMIVELLSDYAYDTCHPCPKCDPLLRAVGIPTVLHTTPHGRIVELDLRPANAALLSNENVSIPLNAACRERNIT